MAGMKSANEATGLDYRQRICRAMNFISAHLGREPTLEEIAAALHVLKGTVSARMTRGRQKLKTWMEEEL